VVFSIRLRGELTSQHETTVATDGLAEFSISLKNPKLWYPHGYGAQTLYNITVDVSNGEFQLDKFPSEQVYDVESSIRTMIKLARAFISGSMGLMSSVLDHAGFLLTNFIPRLKTEKYRK
jgi:beta-mannosidase